VSAGDGVDGVGRASETAEMESGDRADKRTPEMQEMEFRERRRRRRRSWAVAPASGRRGRRRWRTRANAPSSFLYLFSHATYIDHGGVHFNPVVLCAVRARRLVASSDSALAQPCPRRNQKH